MSLSREEIVDKYLSNGFKIIPLKGKKRFTKEDQEVDIRNYYFGLDKYNLGVLTGNQSGIIVIDCDRSDNERISKEQTRACKTPNGIHYYFRLPKECRIRNAQDIFKTRDKGYQVDVRGEGGYAVMPPSDGYKWLPDNKIIKPLPNWLVELLTCQVTTAPKRLDEDLPDEGHRHDWFMRRAGRLFGKGHDLEEATTILLSINESKVEPPLEEDELKDLIERIYDAEIRKQRREEEHKEETITDDREVTIFRPQDGFDDYRKYLETRGKQECEPEITTGFKELDKTVWGFQRGELISIYGKPNAGKSLAILKSAFKNARRGLKCIIFSTESSRNSVLNRLFANLCKIESFKFRKGNFTQDDEQRLSKGYAELKDLSMYIDDDMGVGINEIEKTTAEHQPDIIYVDYFQRMKFENDSHFFATEVVKRLKNIARRHNIPVVVGTQVNVQKRMVKDRETGNIDWVDADVTSSDCRTTQALWHESDIVLIMNSRRNKMTQQIAIKMEVDKARDTDYCVLYYELDKTYLRYKNITREHYKSIL